MLSGFDGLERSTHRPPESRDLKLSLNGTNDELCEGQSQTSL